MRLPADVAGERKTDAVARTMSRVGATRPYAAASCRPAPSSPLRPERGGGWIPLGPRMRLAPYSRAASFLRRLAAGVSLP